MGLFGEVKCGRCDRRYSALRGRCPYCGARRNKAKDAENGGGNGGGPNLQLIAGIVLLVIVVIAVIVLIWMSLKPDEPKPTPTPTQSAIVTDMPTNPSTNSPTPTLPSVTPTQSPVQTPTPTIPVAGVTSVRIDETNLPFGLDVTLSGLGDRWTLEAIVTPAGTGLPVTWVSDNDKIVSVTAGGVITAMGDGMTNVYAVCGGVKSKPCLVRVVGVGSQTPQPAGAPTLSHTDVTLYLREVNGADWSSFRLSTSSAATANFRSSNTEVATVSGGGFVQATGTGTCTIYVDVDGYTLSCTVRVWLASGDPGVQSSSSGYYDPGYFDPSLYPDDLNDSVG